MKRIALAGLVFFVMSGLTEAADLQIAKSPPLFVPPSFSWTGLYVGANVGAGFGTTETSVDVSSALTAVTGTPISGSAPL